MNRIIIDQLNKRNIFLFTVFYLVVNASLAAATDRSLALESTLGSNGIGLKIEKPISEKLSATIGVASLAIDTDYEADGIDYNAELSQHTINTSLVWYPFGSRFQAVLGLSSIQGDYRLEARGQNSYEIGSDIYEGNITLKSEIIVPRVNPYLGVGWRNKNTGAGISFGLDLGVFWLGDIQVTMAAEGSAVNSSGDSININSDPDFLTDLAEEQNSLEEDIKKLIHPWMPVGLISLGYRF